MLSLDEPGTEKLRARVSESALLVREECRKAPLFSLVIPVYNEASIVVESLRVLHLFLGRENCELIVFDDCSVDGTGAKLEDSSPGWRNPGMLLLHSPIRIGKGGSIKRAVERATGGVVVFMDADLSADLRSLAALMREARWGGGLVIGERSVSDRSAEGFLRVVLSLAYNAAVRVFFRTGVRDHQCGFKAMKMDVARRLMAKTRNDGFVFDTELIVVAKKLGVPVRRVPVRWVNNRPKRSNLRWIGTGITMMKDLATLKLSELRHS